VSVVSVSAKIDRARLARIADASLIGVAVALPWSTSATWILLALWLAALLPTLTVADLRRELISPAGGLPVLLWLLAALGMLWADIPWSERFDGLGGFHKLLAIPFALAQFRRSDAGMRVVAAFFASLMAVLVASFALALIPGLTWRGDHFGVPVRDYIWQSGVFLLCAFALSGLALDLRQRGSRRWALALALLIVILVINIAFVATGRTTLVAAAILLIVFGFKWFGWKGAIVAAFVGVLLWGALSASSQYLRERITTTVSEVDDYRSGNSPTSTGLRLEFLKKSANFIMAAPLIGHGTGSIEDQFRQSAVGEGGASALISVNPHNQVLMVGIQLGLVGVVVLAAMWIAQLLLFRGSGLINWFGTVVVVQNIVGSMFNSHLTDFTQGTFYVFGVGVLGGMALRQAGISASATVQAK
jgi:O-antigen ligase